MSITAAAGFVASGVHCGIKASGDLDLSVVATEGADAVPTAAVFTSNRAPAAPVQVSRSHLASTGGMAAAVILNSGNANAATGTPGQDHAVRTCALTAEALGCRAEEVLVCSTGLIGIPLPFEALAGGIAPLVGSVSGDDEGAVRAATALLTTDTRRKEVVVRGAGYVVGGMAKGAAMLAPNMATMLAVLTTDAAVDTPTLQAALSEAVADSFNALSVDGCTSTNDTVIILASGRAGRPPSPAEFAGSVEAACADLAAQMAGDAEGATKVVRVRVTGAASAEEARRAARKVAESQLVKCSLYGEDPYWGRVVSELGSAGVAFDPDLVTVSYGGVAVCRRGVAAEHDIAAVKVHLAGRNLELSTDLGIGDGTGVILTNDLTPGYIDENMRTS